MQGSIEQQSDVTQVIDDGQVADDGFDDKKFNQLLWITAVVGGVIRSGLCLSGLTLVPVSAIMASAITVTIIIYCSRLSGSKKKYRNFDWLYMLSIGLVSGVCVAMLIHCIIMLIHCIIPFSLHGIGIGGLIPLSLLQGALAGVLTTVVFGLVNMRIDKVTVVVEVVKEIALAAIAGCIASGIACWLEAPFLVMSVTSIMSPLIFKIVGFLYGDKDTLPSITKDMFNTIINLPVGLSMAVAINLVFPIFVSQCNMLPIILICTAIGVITPYASEKVIKPIGHKLDEVVIKPVREEARNGISKMFFSSATVV
ncbi:hypothetical protein BIY23_02540 [Wolbachia pipientis]|uniref:Uncharacterized protein n=1 Tax=Wolbachia pipientis TaxID=955 RepID=A0A1E7QKH1_WOLPI|nr:hypothetical protein [Wolbachia pipientis]OEY86714.1 hypothetical protein BIY23_02540 [Wolbachia pipientis]